MCFYEILVTCRIVSMHNDVLLLLLTASMGKNSFFFDTSLAQFFFRFWTHVFRKMTEIGFPKIGTCSGEVTVTFEIANPNANF